MNGVLIVNKPEGITSQGTVSKIKRILNVNKCGHAGTLDPLATGVIPILIGSSTKISKYLIEHDKTYNAIIKLGNQTSTGDREGEIIKTAEVPELNENKIIEVLNSFLGKQIQTPPIYSAIKVDGKKLYEYARENKVIEIPKREIEIYQIKLIKFDKPKNTITFETFKKICNEIECGLSEQQLNDIFKIAASNGDEITFKEFEEYMKVEPDN